MFVTKRSEIPRAGYSKDTKMRYIANQFLSEDFANGLSSKLVLGYNK